MSAWLRYYGFPESRTIDKVITRYRSRFIFVRYLDVPFFFRAGLSQCNSLIINIFVLRLKYSEGNDLLLYFFAFFVSGRQ